ncbi:MAG: GH3 auxin-responsive promoter family protein, partial [Candidatus Eisenbacteria bacterium]|nr:GH3 auxin-responsive promoter family protein [Candidatus Eisenbacteria bacterium]
MREGSLVFRAPWKPVIPPSARGSCSSSWGPPRRPVARGHPAGVRVGVQLQALPWLVRRRFVVPYWVFTIDDADERNYAAGRILVAERGVGALCAISPVNLINLRRAMESQAERLCDDIAAGTLGVRGSSAMRGSFPDASGPRPRGGAASRAPEGGSASHATCCFLARGAGVLAGRN